MYFELAALNDELRNTYLNTFKLEEFQIQFIRDRLAQYFTFWPHKALKVRSVDLRSKYCKSLREIRLQNLVLNIPLTHPPTPPTTHPPNSPARCTQNKVCLANRYHTGVRSALALLVGTPAETFFPGALPPSVYTAVEQSVTSQRLRWKVITLCRSPLRSWSTCMRGTRLKWSKNASLRFNSRWFHSIYRITNHIFMKLDLN